MSIIHPPHPPSTHATIRVNYGSEYKHLYTIDNWGGVSFHKDEAEARANARRIVEDDANAIVAILRVDELIAAKIDVQTVSLSTDPSAAPTPGFLPPSLNPSHSKSGESS